MRVFRTYSAVTCFIAGFTAACFSGCSVTPPTMKIGLALYPPADAEFETTPDAYQLVRWDVGDYRLALSPRGGLDDMLDLWLSIENHGEDTLDFFPSQIQYAYCSFNPQTELPSKARPTPSQGAKPLDVRGSTQPQCTSFKAIPSQTQVVAHLAQRERKRKEADNADEAAMAAAMIVFVFAIIFVVAAASSSGSSKRGGGHRQGHSYTRGPPRVPILDLADSAQQATFTSSYGGRYSEVPADVAAAGFIGNLKYALAESVLAPGNRHAGHIFIPPYENASFLRLQIGLGRDATTLDFDYQPRKFSNERSPRGAR